VLRHENKKRLVNYLENLNIETRDLLPLLNQPIYRRIFGQVEDQYPVARWVNQSGFYIGCHYYMTDDEVEFVVQAFHEFFTNSYMQETLAGSSEAARSPQPRNR
jgi:dTDP-4-amino-4,6-dideoxygalactose transaminase